MDRPLAVACGASAAERRRISQARVVLGHVAPDPICRDGRRQFLAGKSIDEKTAEEAGREALTSAKPLSQNGYKVKLAQVAVKRALLEAGRKA